MIISILRINSLVTVSYTDITMSAAYPLLWSFIEPAIGITVACGPILRPLLEKLFPQSFSRKDKPSNSHGFSKFSRLDEQAHPLHKIMPPNVSVVTSSGMTEDAGTTSDDILDLESQEPGASYAVVNPRGITVQREFFTHHD